MILKTSNGDKEYSVKELNFVNVMCDLEDNGIDVMALLDEEKRENMKVFTTMRAIISVITGVKDKDEAFKDVQANYGADFSNETIVQRVQKEVSTNGALQATLNSGGGLKEAVKEALTELGIADKVSEIASDAKRQADKKEQTIVQIGNRTITDAVTSQQSANGFRFQPT